MTDTELLCFICRDWGHIAAFCPKKESLGIKAASKTVLFNHLAGEVDGEPAAETSHVESGVLNGKSVTVLVDTGSCMSVVQADLEDKSKLEEGTAELKCVHSDLISHPTAQITLSCSDAKITGGCSKDYSSADEMSSITSLAVLTRSRRRK